MDNITNGEWVTCEDGIAKILHIFPKYAEEFDLNINKKVLYEFECYIYIGKVFCDFKGKIKAYQYPIAAN